MAQTATRNRSPHWITISGNNVVQLQLVASSYSAGLLTELGIEKGAESGEVPQGKTQVGEGRADALNRGCFPIVIKYAVGGGKSQTAKVLCSPSKADTVMENAKNKTYRGKNITKVRPPRRRVFTF